MSLTRVILLLLVSATSACMTYHDAEISASNQGKQCNFQMGALFDNHPDYLSRDKENTPIARISRLFGNYNEDIVAVSMTEIDGRSLMVRFYGDEKKEIGAVELIKGEKYESDGTRITLNNWSSCKPGEAGAGCTWSHVELSCTQENELAVKEVRHGAGMIALVVPIVTSGSYLAVFKRLPNE